MTSGKIAVITVGAGVLAWLVAMYCRTALTQTEEPAPEDVRVVEVRNDCADPVWVSYGRTPPLRREDAVTIGARASSFEPLIEGDEVWLLDASKAPLAHAGVGASTNVIRIDASCKDISAVDP